jgi:hypothetical protein
MASLSRPHVRIDRTANSLNLFLEGMPPIPMTHAIYLLWEWSWSGSAWSINHLTSVRAASVAPGMSPAVVRDTVLVVNG